MKKGCEGAGKGKTRSIELPVLNNLPAKSSAVARSRTSKWRAVSLIALTALMIAHYVQWRYSGTTLSPIEPSETMYTLQSGAINAGFIFFVLAILSTLVFGRFVCGWGCHIVALQDLCAWLLEKVGLRPRPFRSRLLVFVPLIAALYMFVWPTVLRLIASQPNAPVIPQFTNHLIVSNFWSTFPPFLVAIPFLFVCGFMTVYFMGSKGFCTYACPYGGFFGVADRLAPGKIRVTDACNECGHCTATCTSNVIVHAEVKQFGMVVDPACMKCMDCISVCPNDALYFGFGKPSVLARTASDTVSPPKKTYSLTWPEEGLAAAVFLLSLLAVWDVYQLVPLLMALGIASVTTYLVLRSWRLFRAADQSFYRYSLKISGKMQAAGWAFLAFTFLWTGLVEHSGFIRYNERAGALAFQNLQIPDELALAQPNPVRWLSASDQVNIAAGKKALHNAVDFGLLTNGEALPKLAWLEYLSGNTELAADLLGRAAEHQDGEGRILSLYYRGAILNRLGRYNEAVASLDRALAESPGLAAAREERGVSLWQVGRRDEAAAAWTSSTTGAAGRPLAYSLLAGAASAAGNTDGAAAYETQADRFTPNDPLFHWMLGLRLQNVGMTDLAEKHFSRAIQLNPEFRRARPPAGR